MKKIQQYPKKLELKKISVLPLTFKQMSLLVSGDGGPVSTENPKPVPNPNPSPKPLPEPQPKTKDYSCLICASARETC